MGCPQLPIRIVRPLIPDPPSWPLQFVVALDEAGRRLDVFLTGKFSAFSRASVRRAIDAGHVRVDGDVCKASLRLKAGWQVDIQQLDVPREGPAPEAIPLTILHEDDSIIVVDKPAGMIVHPAKGHWAGTLASALAHHFGPLSGRGGPTRPGIVHRLDRDTSGVIIVAKNDQAHEALAAQFKARQVTKDYLAIVAGVPNYDRDVIDEPIGDHPTHREKKAIHRADANARAAVTAYEVVERFAGYTLVRALPKTGRTHQIRLHLAHIGCPVLCDRLYGGRARITELELITRDKIAQDMHENASSRVLLERQALHAQRLSIAHPTAGERMTFEAALPVDMEATLVALRLWRTR